jgi:hypothetical protein
MVNHRPSLLPQEYLSVICPEKFPFRAGGTSARRWTRFTSPRTRTRPSPFGQRSPRRRRRSIPRASKRPSARSAPRCRRTEKNASRTGCWRCATSSAWIRFSSPGLCTTSQSAGRSRRNGGTARSALGRRGHFQSTFPVARPSCGNVFHGARSESRGNRFLLSSKPGRPGCDGVDTVGTWVW